MAAANPRRPSIPARQSTGPQTHSRRTSLTGSGNVLDKVPSNNGHTRRLSGSVGGDPNSRPAASRRGSVIQASTINPALVNTYTYVGMMGHRNYFQDGFSYESELLTPKGKLTKYDTDLAPSKKEYSQGDLLFQNSWDNKLYEGYQMTPAFPYRFAGYYVSAGTWQNPGIDGPVWLKDFKGRVTDDTFYSNDTRGGGGFTPREVCKLSKGDDVWYCTRDNMYYAAKSFFG